MAKKKLLYHVPLSVLLADDGTKEALVAIAYYRGEGRNYAGPVRDGLAEYVKNFQAGLSPANKKAFNEILDQVKLTMKMEKAISGDNPSGKSPPPG